MSPKNHTEDLLELEKANVAIVNAFVESWYEPEKTLFSLIAPDGVCRTDEPLPPAIGPEECKKKFERTLKPTDRVEVVTYQTYAKGPIVMNVRSDTLKSEGKPDRIFEIVGVFKIVDGKIQEWTDHAFRWKEAP